MGISSPQGVDLLQAARVAAKEKTSDTITTKGFNGHTVLLEPPQSRARGKGSRSIERPQWTTAELGQAAAGIPRIEFLAACFSFAGDRSNFWLLHRALYAKAIELRALHRWSDEVLDIFGIKRPYLQHLAKLVLDADASPAAFVVPEVYAVFMGVRFQTWERLIEPCYRELTCVWESWIRSAAARIQSKLEEGEF